MVSIMQAGAFDFSRKVDVLCAEERSSAYLDHDLEKNIFGSIYHVREPKTRRLPMTVPDFTVCLTSWTSKKLLLKVYAHHLKLLLLSLCCPSHVMDIRTPVPEGVRPMLTILTCFCHSWHGVNLLPKLAACLTLQVAQIAHAAVLNSIGFRHLSGLDHDCSVPELYTEMRPLLRLPTKTRQGIACRAAVVASSDER